MMAKIHVYMCLHIASIKFTARNKTTLFRSPFFISTSWLLVLAQASRNDHGAACTTALRGATDKNEKSGYVTVRCSSKMIQQRSTVGWLKF